MMGRRAARRTVTLPRFVVVAVSAVLALVGGAATATATRPDEQPADLPSGQSALQRAHAAPHATEQPVVTTAVHLRTDDLGHSAAAALAAPPRLVAPAAAGSATDRALSAADVGSVSTQRNRAPPAADHLTS